MNYRLTQAKEDGQGVSINNNSSSKINRKNILLSYHESAVLPLLYG